MPVSLDTDRTSPELAERTTRAGAGSLRTDSNSLHIGLINNMPDGALQATERQFVKLLDSASKGISVRLSLYALRDVPRTDWGRSHVKRYYSSVESLWDTRLDGLIVTGAEPMAPQLIDEPYWGSLGKVFEWAEHNTNSTIWSCLAAHAAVLHFDGIGRRRLEEKRFGVFNCTAASDDLLTTGAPSVLRVPHSRWNDLHENDLTDSGYRILARAQDGSVDSFVKRRKSLFVFLQGHPEYEGNTLLLEYRRDVGRYLRRERDTYPRIPAGYFCRETVNALEALRERAQSDRREAVLEDFPFALAEKGLRNRWHSTGAHLYRNWLGSLNAQKQRRSVLPASAESKKVVARRRAQL